MLFIHQTEEEPLSLRLAGQQWDAESGLSYNIHRYYDPARGRYLSPDPLGAPDGSDRYAYLNGNPDAGIDPLGLFAIPTEAFAGYPYLPTTDNGGHGDILRIAFAQYNMEYGLRFSQAIIDQIILNNYHTDSQASPGFNSGGGQGNPNNHFDNPNSGPVYELDKRLTPSYSDGVGDSYIQDALDQIKANRMYYQNATYAGSNGIDISRILSKFGQNSHALADFYAHTNWVDAPERGGCIRNSALGGLVVERGYVPAGLGQTGIWNESVIDGMFSGTVELMNRFCSTPLGDIHCDSDKTTHGYWAKDDAGHAGGAEAYDGPEIYRWKVEEFDGTVPRACSQ